MSRNLTQVLSRGYKDYSVLREPIYNPRFGKAAKPFFHTKLTPSGLKGNIKEHRELSGYHLPRFSHLFLF